VLLAYNAFDSQQRSYLPAPILKPKWVRYKKEHRKVDTRGLTVVHLTGAAYLTGVCIPRAIIGAWPLIGVSLSQAYI